jgi:hypothetical protein
MSPIWEGRLGGGGRGVSNFLDPPSRILLRHFLKILFIYLESSAQELSIGTLFEVSGGTVKNCDDLNFEDNIPFEMSLWTTWMPSGGL